MRVLCSIVEVRVLAVLHARQDLTFRRSIPFQLIGDNHTRNVLQSFEKLAEKSLRRFLVASALHEDVESIAVLVHCPPKILRFPVDLQVHFIQVPCVSTTRTATTQFIGRRLPKFQTPLSHGFRGDDDPALGVVRSSTSRKLSEKRKYSQTAWLI